MGSSLNFELSVEVILFSSELKKIRATVQPSCRDFVTHDPAHHFFL